MEILKPIEIAVAWIMVTIHNGLTNIGFSQTSGVAWALSIVGLTVVIRLLLVPLFVKQINASRSMQLIQPELQKIQKKYKGKTDQASKEALAREQFALFREHNTNPLASCLPLLLQSPIFFALFRVLSNLGKIADGRHDAIGPITHDVARTIENAPFLFGARMSDTFTGSGGGVKLLCLFMIIAMSVATFYSQKMLMSKNMPTAAMESNPFMQQQKMMLYIMPVIFAVTGVSFPMGVLIYSLTSNLWTAGQQFYVIHRLPAPGSQAEKEMNERRARRGKAPIVHTTKRRSAGDGGSTPVSLDKSTEGEAPRPTGGQRQQPRRRNRNRSTGARPAGNSGASVNEDRDPS